MESTAIANIRQAVEVAQQAALAANFDGCDMDDIDQLIEPVRQELDRSQPNAQTLTTYLNSLARSLKPFASARSACLRLDAAMREAGLATNWEH